MPRKMSGSAMRTMEASIVAISMPSVVMNSAIHLCRSLAWAWPATFETAVTPSSLVQPCCQVPRSPSSCAMPPPRDLGWITAGQFRNRAFRLC